jgi:hypothetical protein
MNPFKYAIWQDFCKCYQVATEGVSLFQAQGDRVRVVQVGKTVKRLVLERAPEMEEAVIREVGLVIDDYAAQRDQFDGLIYIMYKLSGDEIVPLYIGKSEKFGKNGGNLSANIKNIDRNKDKFCRWGYNYAYHVGDLSAIVCLGHREEKKTRKYTKWADALFEKYPSDSPKLRFPLFFWIKAWEKGSVGIWKEFGETSLTFLEYLLIGVASDLYPDDLLNEEGVNRV